MPAVNAYTNLEYIYNFAKLKLSQVIIKSHPDLLLKYLSNLITYKNLMTFTFWPP